jgi:hypothetical protein
MDTSQAYFWTPGRQSAEREASADIAAGRRYEADDTDDLVAQLRRARQEALELHIEFAQPPGCVHTGSIGKASDGEVD